MSSHPHHHHLPRPSSRKTRRAGDGGAARTDIDRLLDPSYASHSQTALKRPSMDAATYIDSQGVAHDSAYNPFAGLDSIGGGNGPRRNHYARQSSTDSEASFGGIGGLPSQSAPMGRSRSGRSTASAMGAVGTAGGRRRNQPASDMSLGGGYDSLAHGGGGGGKSSRAPSIASTQYPTTTTAASKSRRSTLMSQTTAFTDHSELVPPSPSRFKGAYGSYKGPGTHNIPSPPSSVASSAAPQIYPETPAQREARRRSTERSRPVNYSSSLPVAPPLSAILPPRPRPALESAFSGSERGGGGGGESSTGATSHYVPTKWKEERELKRGGVDEEFRPQEKEKEYRPAVGDNMKRSWNEISLAVRFGMFRTKKKIERKATGRG